MNQQQLLQQQLLQQQQQQAQQAAGSSQPSASAQGASALPGASNYTVISKGNDQGEVVIRTLVGDYVEKGANHGRKFFQKLPNKGGTGDFVEVYLYYWDSRDGPSFEGWWFGNKLGGTQVWSHNSDKSLIPPTSGWKIPWDGQVRPTLVLGPKQQMQREEAETKLKAISAEVAKVDAEAKQAVSQASALGNNQSNMQSLLQAEQLLQPHSTAMMEVQRKLQDAQKGHPGDIARNFSQLANQLRMTQQQAQQLTNKFRQSRIQAESQAKMAEAELRETKAFEDMMPDVSQKCTAAEEAIEKAIATHEAIASSSDGDNQVSASVEETEAAVKEAEKAATEASVILQAKMNQIRRFESPKVRDNSAQELQKVQQKLQSAQSKLQPLKSVRQELAQRVAAQQALKEIQEKMAPLEEDFAAAEEAAVPVSSGDATEEQQAAAEQALQKVQDQLAALKRLCQTKKQPGGLVLAAVAKELASPEERIADFDVKLKALQDTKRQSGERLALKALAMDADQRLHALTEALQKVQDLQAPLNSEEELPAAKALQSLRVLEGPVTACGTAASVAKIFLMVKSVEVNNFSPLLAAEGQAKIKQFQIQLEEMTKLLAEVKSKAAEQKKLAYTKEAQRLSKRAEELATQVGEAVADLADDAKLSSLSREEIRKAQAAAVKAEEEGTGAVRQAKAALSQWQREDAAGESAQELSELHERVDNARSAMTKHARVSKSVDQRLDALQMVEEKLAKMTELESQATRMSDIIAKVSEADADASQLQKAEDAVKILQREVRSQSRDVDNQLQSRDEALRDLAEKLRDRLTPIVAKMDGALSTLRTHSEKALVKASGEEASKGVQDMEAAVKAATEAQEAFQKAVASSEQEGTEPALTALEAAIKAASSSVNGTKSLLGVKRLDLKRLSSELTSSTLEEMDNLQKRLDDGSTKLAETKKIVADHQSEAQKKELDVKLKETAELCEAAKKSWEKITEDMPTEQKRSECRQTGAHIKKASDAVTHLDRLAVTTWRSRSQSDNSMLPEIQGIVKQVEAQKAELETLRSQLRDVEAKIAGQRIAKESVELLDALEKKMAGATCSPGGGTVWRASEIGGAEEAAVPLFDDSVDLCAAVFLKGIIEACQASFKRTNETAETVVDKLIVADDQVSEDKFISFLTTLSELQASENVPMYSAEELKAAYRALLPPRSENTQVSKAKLLDMLKKRYVCVHPITITDSLAIKGGKTVRRVAVNEALEALADPVEDTASGLQRVRVKAEKDAREGFVTLQTINGTTFAQPFSSHQVLTLRVSSSIDEMNEALAQTARLLDLKMQATRNAGPALADLKDQVGQLRGRMATVQVSLNTMKKKLSETKRLIQGFEQAESMRKQEALDRHEAEKMTSRAKALMDKVRPKLEEVIPQAEALLEAGITSETAEALISSEKAMQELYEAIVDMRNQLAKDKQAVRYVRQGPLLQVWDVVTGHLNDIWTPEEKTQQLLQILQEKRKKLTSDAQRAVASAIREAASKEGLRVEALFEKLRKEKATIPVQELSTFVSSAALQASEIQLGLERYEASGFTKLGLTLLLQDYMKCIKEVVMTDLFDVKEGKTVKKLSFGDMVEVLEPGKDDESGLTRFRCRALNDLAEGWVSLKGTAGTVFLERCAKPYLCCREEFILQGAFEASSDEVLKIHAGQVVEVLEGPRREPATECLRVRCRAVKDGKMGFITLKDAAGNDLSESVKVLVCRLGTTLTTDLDVSASKTVRKVEIGEVFEALDSAKEDEKRKLSRVKVRTWRDDKEGWVTLTGNSGTCYVEESDQHHIVKKTLPMETAFRSGSAVLRQLEEKEVFELLEAPKTEKKEGDQRMRGRLADQEGWFTLSKFLTPWSPRYRCTRSIDLTEGLGGDSAVVSKLQSGELVEALELPQFDDAQGVVSVRIRVEKDNTLGYATLREQQAVYLEALAPEKPREG